MDGRVPVEAEFRLARARERGDLLGLERRLAHAQELSPLVLRIDDVLVFRIGERLEAVADAHVLPMPVADAAGPPRWAHPAAVVLQATIDVVGNLVVDADVIELRQRQAADE